MDGYTPLAASVLEVLQHQSHGLLAREIAADLRYRTGRSVDRRDVNRALYYELGGTVLVSPSHRWRLAGVPGSTGRSAYVRPGSPPEAALDERSASTTCMRAFQRLQAGVGKRFREIFPDCGPDTGTRNKGEWGFEFERLAGGCPKVGADFDDGDLKTFPCAQSVVRPRDPIALGNASRNIDMYLDGVTWFESPLARRKCENLVLAGYRPEPARDQRERILACVGLLELGPETAAGRQLAADFADVLRELRELTNGGTQVLPGRGARGKFLHLKAKGSKDGSPTKSKHGVVIYHNGLAFYLLPSFVEEFLKDARRLRTA